MAMPRALFAVALAVCAAVPACGDGTTPPTEEPPPGTLPDVFAGRWVLQTVNGENLPAMNRIANRLMLGGMLDLPTSGGSPVWTYCFDSLSTTFFSNADVSLYDFDLDDGQAELWTFLTLPLPVVDTILVSEGTLTWEYNLRSEPGGLVTDILRFRRSAPLEPSPCR